MTGEQHQKGGLGSVNIQVGTVKAGLSYADVRDIARDVFDANFEKLVAAARETANERAQRMRDDLADALAGVDPAQLAGFAQPDKQSALFEAQKAYALTGDDELRTTLVQMVVNIANENGRSLKAIVLQEAIKILPSLRPEHTKVLAAAFLLRYVRTETADNLSALVHWFEQHLGSIFASIKPTIGDFRHIEYARCGSVELGEISSTEVLRRSYPGIFAAGFGKDVFENHFKDAGGVPAHGIIQCINDPSKFQIGALNADVLDERAKQFNWKPAQLSAAKILLPQHLLGDDEIKRKIRELNAAFGAFLDTWDNTGLKSLKLTSVGLAVGHSVVSARVHGFPDPGIWI